jgi:tetratricopeptide (TPR) repeat protein
MRRRTLSLAALTLLLLPATLFACLWDYDTLAQERARFPGTLELITGKFLRHSPEFYEWRIRDRLARLQREPDNLAYLDDLAVAYDKTGQHAKAIETMQAKEKKHPGLYETAANLGTFYIHVGEPEKGLPYIEKAIQINPDAHFGREKYQKLLVEYVLERRKDGNRSLPLYSRLQEPSDPVRGFASFLAPASKEYCPAINLSNDERQAAIRGILGMMRFGQYDSPVLLEALGNLLSEGIETRFALDAKQLAARAYLKAAYEVTDEDARKRYRELAEGALFFQVSISHPPNQMKLDELEAKFQQEFADARDWSEKLRQDEMAWIRDGKDPEAEFAKLYTEEPQVVALPEDDPRPVYLKPWFIPTVVGSVVIFGLGATALVIRALLKWMRGA